MQGCFYERYMTTDNETRWATDFEIKNAASFIDLFEQMYLAAGLPLVSDGKRAYVDNEDNHSIMFGTTGSKKNRLFCMPMLNVYTCRRIIYSNRSKRRALPKVCWFCTGKRLQSDGFEFQRHRTRRHMESACNAI